MTKQTARQSFESSLPEVSWLSLFRRSSLQFNELDCVGALSFRICVYFSTVMSLNKDSNNVELVKRLKMRVGLRRKFSIYI